MSKYKVRRMWVVLVLVIVAAWIMSFGLYIKSVKSYEQAAYPDIDEHSAMRIVVLPTIKTRDVYWGVSKYIERGPYRLSIAWDSSDDTKYQNMVLNSIVVRYDEGRSEQLIKEPLAIPLEEWSFHQGRREGLVEMSKKGVRHTIKSPLKLDFGTDSSCTVFANAVLVQRNGEKDNVSLRRKFEKVSEFKVVPYIVVLRSL